MHLVAFFITMINSFNKTKSGIFPMSTNFVVLMYVFCHLSLIYLFNIWEKHCNNVLNYRMMSWSGVWWRQTKVSASL